MVHTAKAVNEETVAAGVVALQGNTLSEGKPVSEEVDPSDRAVAIMEEGVEDLEGELAICLNSSFG